MMITVCTNSSPFIYQLVKRKCKQRIKGGINNKPHATRYSIYITEHTNMPPR